MKILKLKLLSSNIKKSHTDLLNEEFVKKFFKEKESHYKIPLKENEFQTTYHGLRLHLNHNLFKEGLDYELEVNEDVSSNSRSDIQSFSDIIKRIDPELEVEDFKVEATPKGNWAVYFNNEYIGTVPGSFLTDDLIRKYNLEYHDNSLLKEDDTEIFEKELEDLNPAQTAANAEYESPVDRIYNRDRSDIPDEFFTEDTELEDNDDEEYTLEVSEQDLQDAFYTLNAKYRKSMLYKQFTNKFSFFDKETYQDAINTLQSENIKIIKQDLIEEKTALQEGYSETDLEDKKYKELEEFLDEEGIFGYTNRIHDIMMGNDEEFNPEQLDEYLSDPDGDGFGIFGYTRRIEKIYEDVWGTDKDQIFDDTFENGGMNESEEILPSASQESKEHKNTYKKIEKDVDSDGKLDTNLKQLGKNIRKDHLEESKDNSKFYSIINQILEKNEIEFDNDIKAVDKNTLNKMLNSLHGEINSKDWNDIVDAYKQIILENKKTKYTVVNDKNLDKIKDNFKPSSLEENKKDSTQDEYVKLCQKRDKLVDQGKNKGEQFNKLTTKIAELKKKLGIKKESKELNEWPTMSKLTDTDFKDDDLHIHNNLDQNYFYDLEDFETAYYELYDQVKQEVGDEDNYTTELKTSLTDLFYGNTPVEKETNRRFEIKYGVNPSDKYSEFQSQKEDHGDFDYDTRDSEGEEDWVDPAGGSHSENEEDPAKMYESRSRKRKKKLNEGSGENNELLLTDVPEFEFDEDFVRKILVNKYGWGDGVDIDPIIEKLDISRFDTYHQLIQEIHKQLFKSFSSPDEELNEDDYYGPTKKYVDHKQRIQDLVDAFIEEQIGSESAWGYVRGNGDDIECGATKAARQDRSPENRKTGEELEKAKQNMKEEWIDTANYLIQELANHGYEGYVLDSSGPYGFRISTDSNLEENHLNERDEMPSLYYPKRHDKNNSMFTKKDLDKVSKEVFGKTYKQLDIDTNAQNTVLQKMNKKDLQEVKRINFKDAKLTYNKDTKVISGSEDNIPFDTAYEILNPKTGGVERFEFSHSTGPEFDPKTIYIWKSNSGLTLEITNDEEITKTNADAYLKAKLRKESKHTNLKEDELGDYYSNNKYQGRDVETTKKDPNFSPSTLQKGEKVVLGRESDRITDYGIVKGINDKFIIVKDSYGNTSNYDKTTGVREGGREFKILAKMN